MDHDREQILLIYVLSLNHVDHGSVVMSHTMKSRHFVLFKCNCSYTCNMHYTWSIFYYFQHMPTNHPTQQKQFSYISSPSLYLNPKDRDNESDISTFSKVTPKQSLKFNHSTPSPKNYKPVLHSPVKDVQHAWTSSTMVFPEAVSIWQELSPLLNQLFLSCFFVCLVFHSIIKLVLFGWLQYTIFSID